MAITVAPRAAAIWVSFSSAGRSNVNRATYLDCEATHTASALCKDGLAFQSSSLFPLTQFPSQESIETFSYGAPGCDTSCRECRALCTTQMLGHLHDLLIVHSYPLLQETWECKQDSGGSQA